MSDQPSAAQTLPDVVVYVFDGRGGARAGSLAELDTVERSENDFAFTWIHMRRDAQEARDWLDECGLSSRVRMALTAEDTRPRCTVIGDGAIINLRGVNLNAGAEPEDMISTRLWVEERKIVGIWLRPLRAIVDLFDSIEEGHAPQTPGALIAQLALRLVDRTEPVIASLNERVDRLEEDVLEGSIPAQQSELADIRRTAIILRRFIFPQRDALTTLQIEDLPWLADRDRGRIGEAVDRVTRVAEELDAIRDRSSVIHDQIMERRSSILNRNMLILATVTAIFLPLQFLTGLLGMNVAGIPGKDYPAAFAIVTIASLAIAAGLYWIFRRTRFL